VPGPPFFSAAGGERNIRLSYSQAAPEGIEEGIARLGSLL
jgi:DNA-binding transcriptional MocR family regulator